MNENLTPKQQRAIQALLTTSDVSHAAQEARVSRETLYRWMKSDVFRLALRDGTQQALEGLSRSLVDLGAQAAKTLADALTNAETSTAIKIKAADLVLERLLQLCELVDLENRVSRLEMNIEKS